MFDSINRQKERVSDFVRRLKTIAATAWWEQWWDDSDAFFVVDQHYNLDCAVRNKR
jgi:hypothetical protein